MIKEQDIPTLTKVSLKKHLHNVRNNTNYHEDVFSIAKKKNISEKVEEEVSIVTELQ